MIKNFGFFSTSISLKKIHIFFILSLIFFICKIKSDVVPYLKSIYIGNNHYYLVFPNQINYFEPDVTNVLVTSFKNNQKLQSTNELKFINFGDFKVDNNNNILVFKNYLYSILNEDYASNDQCSNIDGYPPEIITLSCSGNTCYFILGIINSSKILYLYLYKRTITTNSLTGSRSSSINLLDSFSINNVGSENLSCQLMKYNSNNVLTCFYQNDTSKDIVASSFNIDTSSSPYISIIESLTNSKQTNGAKIIKSKISQDGTQSYVCHFTDNNNCDCLIYDINNNEWRNHKTYLNDCIISLDSLHFDYYDMSNEFFLYCHQSEFKFSLVKLNKNFQLANQNFNGIYDFEDYILNEKNCQSYFLSSIVYVSNKINIFFTCNNELIRRRNVQKTTPIIIPIDTTINIESSLPMTTLTTIITTTNPPIENTIIYPNPSTLPKIITTNVEVNNKIVIQERSNKTKEEIIEKLDNGMDNYDIGKIYEIFGSDYNIKISPINSNIYENISTTVNFSNCENILRSKNELSQSSILTVYQIEINNVYEQSLINDVEYAVFNEDKKRLDLSVCEKEVIIINYIKYICN